MIHAYICSDQQQLCPIPLILMMFLVHVEMEVVRGRRRMEIDRKMRSDGSCKIIVGQAFEQRIKSEIKGMVI